MIICSLLTVELLRFFIGTFPFEGGWICQETWSHPARVLALFIPVIELWVNTIAVC